MSNDSYRELTASQLPALRLHMAMGWHYLTGAIRVQVGGLTECPEDGYNQ